MKKYTEIITGITLLKQPLGLSLMDQFSDFVYFNYTIEEALKVARQTDSEEIIQKRTINHLKKWFRHWGSNPSLGLLLMRQTVEKIKTKVSCSGENTQ